MPEALRGKEFDTIISAQVIEHVYSPQKMIEKMKSWLGTNRTSYLIITTPYHGYFKNIALAITGKMDSHFTVLWEGGHIKFLSKKTLSLLLEKNGFRVSSFKGCGRCLGLWKSMLIEAALDN